MPDATRELLAKLGYEGMTRPQVRAMFPGADPFTDPALAEAYLQGQARRRLEAVKAKGQARADLERGEERAITVDALAALIGIKPRRIQALATQGAFSRAE